MRTQAMSVVSNFRVHIMFMIRDIAVATEDITEKILSENRITDM